MDLPPAVAPQLLHTTVLLEEAVEALLTRPDAIYVDGTFGRGGHSRYLRYRAESKQQKCRDGQNVTS